MDTPKSSSFLHSMHGFAAMSRTSLQHSWSQGPTHKAPLPGGRRHKPPMRRILAQTIETRKRHLASAPQDSAAFSCSGRFQRRPALGLIRRRAEPFARGLSKETLMGRASIGISERWWSRQRLPVIPRTFGARMRFPRSDDIEGYFSRQRLLPAAESAAEATDPRRTSRVSDEPSKALDFALASVVDQ
jgi:hypothetical protein